MQSRENMTCAVLLPGRRRGRIHTNPSQHLFGPLNYSISKNCLTPFAPEIIPSKKTRLTKFFLLTNSSARLSHCHFVIGWLFKWCVPNLLNHHFNKDFALHCRHSPVSRILWNLKRCTVVLIIILTHGYVCLINQIQQRFKCEASSFESLSSSTMANDHQSNGQYSGQLPSRMSTLLVVHLPLQNLSLVLSSEQTVALGLMHAVVHLLTVPAIFLPSSHWPQLPFPGCIFKCLISNLFPAIKITSSSQSILKDLNILNYPNFDISLFASKTEFLEQYPQIAHEIEKKNVE